MTRTLLDSGLRIQHTRSKPSPATRELIRPYVLAETAVPD
jgi:hypothetical protein